MMEVNYEIYNDDKMQFFEKHGYDFECTTSPMEANCTYIKMYACKDGAVFTERMSHEETFATATAHGINFEVKVELQKITYWSTDNFRERSYFERW